MNNVDGSDKDDNEEKEEEATSGEDDKAKFSEWLSVCWVNATLGNSLPVPCLHE